MAVMNEFGEGAVFTNVFDDEHDEDLVRALAVVSRNLIAVIDHVNTAAVLRDAIIQGAISQAERIGKAFLEARDSGDDYVSAVLEEGKARPMFRGVVTGSHYETRDGYTFGEIELEGEDDFEGHSLRIWYQNENIISWLDNEPYVTVPDLICVFNLAEAMPQLNPDAEVGEHAAVIALPRLQYGRRPGAWRFSARAASALKSIISPSAEDQEQSPRISSMIWRLYIDVFSSASGTTGSPFAPFL